MKESLYYNGKIITMEEGPAPEAVLVRDGRIAAVGGYADLKKAAGPDVQQRDLEGRALLPAFIDAHSHLSAYANSLLQVSLADAACFADITDKLRSFLASGDIQPGQWVIARGYDHNSLREGRHPDRRVLDAAAPENPVVIAHKSGHVGVFNSCALRQMGVTPETPSPAGGVIEAKDGALTGYMEENAFLSYQRQVPIPSKVNLLEAYRTAQERYAAHGITTVQEGMMIPQMEPLYQYLLSSGLLKLDLVGYASAEEGAALVEHFSDHIGHYKDNFRLGGYKMFLDGSPQGRTAWMRAPYAGERDYCGYGTLEDSKVRQHIETAARQGLQILAHCNGDAACEQYLRACEAAEGAGYPVRDIRPVIIHAQLLGIDQLDRVKALGLIPSFFVGHVYHWGDVHIRNFGVERAAQISPCLSALRRGIRFTFHQDAPVIEPDMLETVWCAVCRETKLGVALGAGERIGVMDALRAVTVNAAYQYGEEDTKGSIAPGKYADLVILERSPLEVPPEAIRTLRVCETIRRDETIYRAK